MNYTVSFKDSPAIKTLNILSKRVKLGEKNDQH